MLININKSGSNFKGDIWYSTVNLTFKIYFF